MRMAPISIAVLRSGDWMIIHRCAQCLELTSNPVSRDDKPVVVDENGSAAARATALPLEAFGDL